MRVVSLVPSWTETLLEAGVEVVGRTRFCLHPREKVAAIPRIGGTKDWNLERILELRPDLLILDREENPRFMSEHSQLPFWASHIARTEDVAPALEDLSTRLGGQARLAELAREWRALPVAAPAYRGGTEIPGVIEWGRQPDGPVEHVLYIIWREPWMRAGHGTFIGSMLTRCGLGRLLPPGPEKYPHFHPEEWDAARTLLLFASEPYPFLRKKHEAAALGFPHAFVDGESFSWFGVRSLRFLQRVLGVDLTNP
jgi:iron complex transport system substrate-binding protein